MHTLISRYGKLNNILDYVVFICITSYSSPAQKENYIHIQRTVYSILFLVRKNLVLQKKKKVLYFFILSLIGIEKLGVYSLYRF